MADLSQKILAEFENIDEILEELPDASNLSSLSTLELAGVAALIHNFYNGIENILKQISLYQNIPLPSGHSWHKELIEISVIQKIISEDCKSDLGKYLAFRHFFSHAYALDLYPNKMEPLVNNSKKVYSNFKYEIKRFYK